MANNENYTRVEDTIPAVNLAKNQQDVGMPSQPLRKEARSLGSFGTPQKKELNDIAEPLIREYKSDTKIAEPAETLKKTETTITEPSVQEKKEEKAITGFSEHQKKTTTSVEETSHQSKEEDAIAVSEDHAKKSEIAITDVDSQKKTEKEISLNTETQTKSEISIDAPDSSNGLSKEEQSVDLPDHLKKLEESVSLLKHQAKTETEIESTTHGSKTETEIASTTHGKKTETEIASTTHDKKAEIEIASTTHQSKSILEVASTTHGAKTETEIASTVHGKKTETEIASTTHGKKTETEIASTTHGTKTETEVESTTHGSKTETEIASTISQKKSEQEINTNREHQKKTEYSYDEILQNYLQTVQQEQNAKKVTTEKYSTQLGNNEAKGFTDNLPIAIPSHTLSLKEQHAGLSDVPRIDGFDVTDVGIGNYVIDKSSIAVINGKTVNNITASTSTFDNKGYFGRTSSKIADKGARIKYADTKDPKVFDISESSVNFTEVRNTSDSEYKPVYNALNLIPPRTGLVDLLKNAATTFGLTKYTSFGIYKPDMNNDTLRFAQRALTGEVARYVYSRLYSNVLLGFNSNKKKEPKPLELSVSGVLDQADKVFDVLSPVVNAMLINPLDLFKDKEALEYKGYIGSMSNQIDRSASGIYKSMSDYYGAVRSKILLRLAGQSDKLLAINAKIEKLALEKATDVLPTSDDPSPTNKSNDVNRKDTWWQDHQLENYKKKKGKLEASIKKLNNQYKEVVIGFDSPSEYTKYESGSSLFDMNGNNRVAWSVSMKRGEDGPEMGEDKNTQRVDPNKPKSLDWRSYNLNRKPSSKDDFESSGFLKSSEYDIIKNLKESAKTALKEQTLHANNADKIVDDMFNFQYILTDYGNNFGTVMTEISDYYKNISANTKVDYYVDPIIHSIPSREMSELYANSMKEAEYAYVTYNGDKKNTPVEGKTIFNDPHLSSLFEEVDISLFNPRTSLFDTIKESESGVFKDVKDQLYRFKGDSLLEKENKDFDINLTTIDYNTNSAISNILQDVKDDSDMSLAEKKNILYQKTLNALSADDPNKPNIRKPKNQMQDLVQVYENDSKLQDTYPDFYSFSWFNSGMEKGDYNSDMTIVLPETDSQIASYSVINKDNTVANTLYREAFTIGLNGEDPEADMKKQVEMLDTLSKSRGKKYVNFGLSMVSSDEKNVIKAVAVPAAKDSANGMDIKIVKKDMSYDDATTATSITEAPDGNTFVTKNDETIRNKESAYYKNIVSKRNDLFSTTTTNMSIKMSGGSFGTIKLFDTGLGGLIVSSAYTIDNQANGNGTVYFTIPFQFNPEISGESRSANWNGVTAFGRTHEHFIYSNSGSRGIQFKTTYAITDYINEDIYDKFGEAQKTEKAQKAAGIERNEEMLWQKGWTEDYVLMILNMYRSLTLPINAYSTVTPPIVALDFGKLMGTYLRTADKYTKSRWVVSEYSIDANLDAGYTLNKNPRLYDVTLSLKEVYDGWHDLQDFYTINKHLQDWSSGKAKE